MINHRILVVAGFAVLSLSLGACATQGDQKAATNNRSNQVCNYDAPIGSHIGNQHCMSHRAHDAMEEANHKKAQSQVDKDGTGGGF